MDSIPKEGVNRNKMESCATTMQWMLGQKKIQELRDLKWDSAWIPLFNLTLKKTIQSVFII